MQKMNRIVGLERFDEDTIHAFVEAELFLKRSWRAAGSAEIHFQVVTLLESLVRSPNKVPDAEIFTAAHFPANADEDFLNISQDLGGVVFRLAEVQDKGCFVVIGFDCAHAKWVCVG